jgi:ubiquitin-protein ligase E3 C
MIKVVFNPSYGLLILNPNTGELYPNPNSQALFPNNEDARYFKFMGKLLGKAMYEGITVEPRFAQFFLRRLIGKQNSLSDLKSLDPELYKQLNFLKSYRDGPVEDLGLYFTTSDECTVTGAQKDVDLIPGGSETPVTD